MKSTFHIDTDSVTVLYSVTLASVLPSILVVGQLLDTWNWLVPFVCVMCTVVSGWLRFAAVDTVSYETMVVAHMLTAPGTALVFAGCKELPSKWFPSERENAVATAAALAFTFFGWAMGALIPPLVVNTTEQLSDFCLKQAIFVSICPFVFVLFHVAVPATPEALLNAPLPEVYGARSSSSPAGTPQGSRRPSFIQKSAVYSASTMGSSPVFILHALGASLLEGVGFSVPALLAEGYMEEGVLSPIEAAWLGFAYIIAGAVIGLLLGFVAPGQEHVEKLSVLTLLIFWSSVVALSCLEKSMEPEPGILGRYSVILILTLISGGTTLGFVGLGLTLACSCVPDVPESHSGSMIAFMAFGFGAIVCDTSVGRKLSVSVGAALVASILVSIGIALRRVSE
eukprot:TRINITY_DN11719_c0_g1_i1.p1 TRINITY_DN11719_c0_g1~~TRINITY_DN11719_c0_g1_i1.p1  ORF type:complete len:458 (+),score=52.64 TRINITY_DN11719_c0_g1_i1:185-1375(+)